MDEEKKQTEKKLGALIHITGFNQHSPEVSSYVKQLTDKIDQYGLPRYALGALNNKVGLFLSPDGENYYDLFHFLSLLVDMFSQQQKALAGLIVKNIPLKKPVPDFIPEIDGTTKDNPFFNEAGIDKKENDNGKDT